MSIILTFGLTIIFVALCGIGRELQGIARAIREPNRSEEIPEHIDTMLVDLYVNDKDLIKKKHAAILGGYLYSKGLL